MDLILRDKNGKPLEIELDVTETFFLFLDRIIEVLDPIIEILDPIIEELDPLIYLKEDKNENRKITM